MRLAGRLDRPIALRAGTVGPGPVAAVFGFAGGARPRLDGAEVSGIRAVDARDLEALIDALSDLSLDARAVADNDVVVRFGDAVEVTVPARTAVRVSGRTIGPASGPILAGPLEISAGDAWVRLAGDGRLRWLSSLARVRVARATLHPDGRVALEGGARRGLDRAVAHGLARAADAISLLVRGSPRFRMVRPFLATRSVV